MPKLQIEYEGAYLKYEMAGNDGITKDTLEINAQDATIVQMELKN